MKNSVVVIALDARSFKNVFLILFILFLFVGGKNSKRTVLHK